MLHRFSPIKVCDPTSAEEFLNKVVFEAFVARARYHLSDGKLGPAWKDLRFCITELEELRGDPAYGSLDSEVSALNTEVESLLLHHCMVASGQRQGELSRDDALAKLHQWFPQPGYFYFDDDLPLGIFELSPAGLRDAIPHGANSYLLFELSNVCLLAAQGEWRNGSIGILEQYADPDRYQHADEQVMYERPHPEVAIRNPRSWSHVSQCRVYRALMARARFRGSCGPYAGAIQDAKAAQRWATDDESESEAFKLKDELWERLIDHFWTATEMFDLDKAEEARRRLLDWPVPYGYHVFDGNVLVKSLDDHDDAMVFAEEYANEQDFPVNIFLLDGGCQCIACVYPNSENPA